MQKKKTASSKRKTGNEKSSELNKFFRIVSDMNRLRILLLLKENTMNVTEIHTKLNLPQNLTSHHISKLKSLDLLKEKAKGTFRNYSINKNKIREYDQMFKRLFGM